MENKYNEEYKRDQDALEAIPRISPEFHFFLDGISQKFLSGKQVFHSEISSLEMVYNMTQSLETDLVNSLSEVSLRTKLGRFEFLFACSYFLAANQNGPSSELIKNAFISHNISSEEFNALADEIQMPSNTRDVLKHIYSKTTQII